MKSSVPRLRRDETQPAFYEVVGNVHVHTVCSDGGGSHESVVRAARQAGLDFVIPTDHDILVKDKEGWYDGVLMLVGEETNDPDLPHPNHYLSLNIAEDVADFARDPQALIDEVRRQGGFGFIAHPCERSGRFLGEPPFNWTRWDVQGYAGISIWNYMSEFKSYLSSLPAALWAVFFPQTMIRGPFPETLALYDRLLRDGRPVALIGASDAHANTYSIGPFRKVIFPYEKLFRTVNMHVLVEEPLNGDLAHDKALIYAALRAGRGYVGYHVLGNPRGFSVVARSGRGHTVATFGQEIMLQREVHIEVCSPCWAWLRLRRDDVQVAERWGRRLSYRSDHAGVYRVEAYRWAWLRWRGWVFTNPIYVRKA